MDRRLHVPVGASRIPKTELGYFRARHLSRLHDLVLKHFIASGLTVAELASRLDIPETDVRALLGAAGNWTTDIVSDLLFAIDGAEIQLGIRYPLADIQVGDRD